MHIITDFHGTRKKFIGSSDIPTLLNLNLSYGESWYTLWKEKTSRAEGFSGNEATKWGNRSEPIILATYAENLGFNYNDIILAQMTNNNIAENEQGICYFKTESIHPEYEFCGSHADMVYFDKVSEEFRIIEAKSTRYMAAKQRQKSQLAGYSDDDFTATGIPLRVRAQEQWQMFCYDIKKAHTAVLVDTSDYREYGPLLSSPRMQEKLLTLARRFWDFVESDTPPPPQTVDDVFDIFPESKDHATMLDESDTAVVMEMKKQYDNIKKLIKKHESEKKDIQKAVMLYAGNNKYLQDYEGNKLATVFLKNRRSVSLSNLPEDIVKTLEDGGYIKESNWKEVAL